MNSINLMKIIMNQKKLGVLLMVVIYYMKAKDYFNKIEPYLKDM